jgi:hypothetical protein
MRFGLAPGGLKLGPGHAAWVDMSRAWWGGSRRRHRQVDLPPGLIRPSPVELNIIDEAALEAELRQLIGDRRKKSMGRRPVVLVLPDLCVRASLLILDAIPPRRGELETLIRWRLDRDACFPMADTRLTWQVLDPRTILTVVIREEVVKQYEAVCEAVGLFAVEVDIATFRLCNLFSNFVPATESVAWLSLLDDGFTLIIFQGGRPSLVRTKARTYGDPEGLLQDVANSLSLHGEGRSQQPPRRLILLSEHVESELVDRMTTELGIIVIQPGWNDVQRGGWAPGAKSQQTGILTAAAGLIGAA